MVYLEKSQPAPTSLAVEKRKANGDYKKEDVLERLKNDFKNKCYICELKAPTSINVEHFEPHKGDIDKKFDWNNLFLSCAHCNNTKLAQTKYDNILNCTNKTHDVENRLQYIFSPFPVEHIDIVALDDSAKTQNTKALLLAIYNGSTPLKKLESANLRTHILNEIKDFQQLLLSYFSDTVSAEEKRLLLSKICTHISRESHFTAFKRWIIKEDPKLSKEFEKYID
ncbi:MAG: HNH endonuclease [Prevotellaceae bacterium]|jgi:uncharacterized protein (TIGR02646 family)|nr:HNH endonuclease [Prevotellaceae bacterium]